MEDYIKREIDKIGKLIEAILLKVGILKQSVGDTEAYQTAKTELLGQLDMDVEALLSKDDFIETLKNDYDFTNINLEKFAELLFDFASAAPDRATKDIFADGIREIYKYLQENGSSISINRYYIIQELENL